MLKASGICGYKRSKSAFVADILSIMDEKNFQHLWSAYSAALANDDYEQADFLVRAAVGFCYTRGLMACPVYPGEPAATYYYRSRQLDLATREQYLIDMLRVLQHQASPEDFQYRCFRDTLKRIFSEGCHGTPLERSRINSA